MGESYSFGETDAILIEKALSGDGSAWEALLIRYERLIYHTALRAGAKNDEAGDVFQAVCLIWLEELGRLRDSQRLGAWLVTTTRRECWARWRKDRSLVEDGEKRLEDEVGVEDSPEALVSQAEDARLLEAGLKQMEDPCRTLLRLLYFDPSHPSYSDIAHSMKIPANSLGPTRARCLEKLREILGRSGW